MLSSQLSLWTTRASICRRTSGQEWKGHLRVSQTKGGAAGAFMYLVGVPSLGHLLAPLGKACGQGHQALAVDAGLTCTARVKARGDGPVTVASVMDPQYKLLGGKDQLLLSP